MCGGGCGRQCGRGCRRGIVQRIGGLGVRQWLAIRTARRGSLLAVVVSVTIAIGQGIAARGGSLRVRRLLGLQPQTRLLDGILFGCQRFVPQTSTSHGLGSLD